MKLYSKGIPEKPVILAAHRKGTTMQLMFAEPTGRLTVFKELALDFYPSILVGISSVLSRSNVGPECDQDQRLRQAAPPEPSAGPLIDCPGSRSLQTRSR